QGIERLRLDLLTRGGQAESGAVHVCEIADQDAVALLVLLGEVLPDRAGLTEAVGEVGVADRDQCARARYPLLHHLPFLLGEVSLGRHIDSSRLDPGCPILAAKGRWLTLRLTAIDPATGEAQWSPPGMCAGRPMGLARTQSRSWMKPWLALCPPSGGAWNEC